MYTHSNNNYSLHKLKQKQLFSDLYYLDGLN